MKAIVLLSGGLDSMCALHWAIKTFDEIYPLHFSYFHAASSRERQAALDISHFYHQTLTMIPISMPAPIPSCEVHKIASPARNLIFLSYAIGILYEINSQHIVFATHLGDVTPCTCTISHMDFISTLLHTAQKQIVFPFRNLTKRNIAFYAKIHNVPIHRSWSCYESEICGVCASCRAREDALNG